MSLTVFVLHYALGLCLLVVPGFWFLPVLRVAGFRHLERLSLAVALGPVLVGLVMMGARALGVPAQTAALLAAAFGLPAVGWAVVEPRGWSINGSARTLSVAALGVALPMAWVIANWAFVPGMRIFNWHALMQVDIINALARNSLPPEEPEMAGLVCSYSWFVNLFWLAQSALTGLSPTVFIVANNLVMLTAQVVLGFALGQRSGLTTRAAWLSTGLTLFGAIVPWVLAKLLQLPVSINLHIIPFLGKYTNLDAMPFAFPFFTGLLILAVRREHVVPRDATALFLLALSLGLVYPFLLPAAGCIVAVWFLRLALGLDRGRMTARQMAALLVVLVGAFVAAVAGPAALVKLVSVDRSAMGVALVAASDYGVANKWLDGWAAMAGMVLLGSLALAAPWRGARAFSWRGTLGGAVLVAFLGGTLVAVGLPTSETFALVCTVFSAAMVALAARRPGHPLATEWLVGFGCLALYAGLDVVRLEYKFLFAASIALAPVAAAGIQITMRRYPLARRILAPSLPAALAAVTVGMVFARGLQIPRSLASAPLVCERCFPMELDPSQPESAWVRCVRESTSPDTIVVSRGDQIHVGAFLDRAMYVPSGAGPGKPLAGYSMNQRHNMTRFRGHSEAVYDRRAETVRLLYEDESVRCQAVAELGRLGRPVVVHLRAGDRSLQTWLRETQVARPLLETGDDSVWIVAASAPHHD